uniref:Sorting nexin 11 n=1 Tax=Pelodiscus sinensis TaxID=13735 RepID=K7FJQ4_PELSI
MGSGCRMLENQEQEELTTVRVQDPRIQNEGSWNSYVDYKIFLHTNSKAFTAKTSCVRRRYREFVWLRKQLQKNAGLVPVPELPGKSTLFAGSTDEFIEGRVTPPCLSLSRVVQNVVLLSDSQLHLFLQSQLPVPEIEACVQGRSPLTVTEAILRYAMSNCGWVQEE